MSELPCYLLPLVVQTTECDARGILYPVQLLYKAQQVAMQHAATLGFGIEFAQQNHLAWVESKVIAQITRLPSVDEQIIVKTYTARKSALVAQRNVELFTPGGEPLALLVCDWVLIDWQTRKPVRLDTVVPDFPRCDVMPVPSLPSIKDEEFEQHGTVPWQTRVTEQDFNAHINNAAYFLHALQSLPSNRQQQALKGFSLQFKKESHVGEMLECHVELCQRASRHTLVCKQQLRAIAQLYW